MNPLSIPVLETDRLILREPRNTDFEPYARFFEDEQSRGIGGPVPRDMAWRKLATLAGHWMLKGYGMWALEEKTTGDLVGFSGLWNPDGWTEREIGWSLMLGKTGHGYATEAALKARHYAYTELGWKTAISLIADFNEASKRVAMRMGATFEEERTIPFQGASLKADIYRHPGPEDLGLTAS